MRWDWVVQTKGCAHPHSLCGSRRVMTSEGHIMRGHKEQAREEKEEETHN